MKRKFSIVYLIILSFFSFYCTSDNKPKDFDYGRVENNMYSNNFFDLTINMPEKWIVQTKEETDKLTERGKELISGDDKNMKASLKASEINTANLISVFQYEVGAPVDFNPNFILVSENLKGFPGIKNGSDYLFQTKKLLGQSQVKYDYVDETFQKININGQEFYIMNASISYGGMVIKQAYYSTLSNGFCLSAIISYTNDGQKTDLLKVINSIKFKKN